MADYSYETWLRRMGEKDSQDARDLHNRAIQRVWKRNDPLRSTKPRPDVSGLKGMRAPAAKPLGARVSDMVRERMASQPAAPVKAPKGAGGLTRLPVVKRPATPGRVAQTFDVGPVPLTPEQIMDLDSRDIAARRAYEEALAGESAGRQALMARQSLDLADIARQVAAARADQMGELADRNLGFSPSSKRVVDVLAARQNDAQARVRAGTADELRKLTDAVRQSETRRNDTLALTDRYRAAYGADRKNLLPGVRY